MMLDVAFKSPINGYLLYAFPFRVLLTFDAGYQWAEQNYYCSIAYINADDDICLEYYDGLSYGGTILKDSPIDIVRYNRGSLDNIVDFVKANITEGRYCIVSIDKYFDGDSFLYKKMHYLHEIMIYGFDEEGVHYLDFTSKKRIDTGFMKYSVLLVAFLNGEDLHSTKSTKGWLENYRVFTLEKDIRECEDLTFLNKMKLYTNEKECERTYNVPCCFGGSAVKYHGYETAKGFYELLSLYKNEYAAHMPLAGVHTLMESKQTIKDHLMKSDPFLAFEYGHVIQIIKQVELLYLKQQYRKEYAWHALYDLFKRGYEQECSFFEKNRDAMGLK